MCQKGFLGRTCSHKIWKMSSDTFDEDIILNQFNLVLFQENFSDGEEKINFELQSDDKPLMGLIINQQEDLDHSLFLQRNPNSKY